MEENEYGSYDEFLDKRMDTMSRDSDSESEDEILVRKTDDEDDEKEPIYDTATMHMGLINCDLETIAVDSNQTNGQLFPEELSESFTDGNLINCDKETIAVGNLCNKRKKCTSPNSTFNHQSVSNNNEETPVTVLDEAGPSSRSHSGKPNNRRKYPSKAQEKQCPICSEKVLHVASHIRWQHPSAAKHAPKGKCPTCSKLRNLVSHKKWCRGQASAQKSRPGTGPRTGSPVLCSKRTRNHSLPVELTSSESVITQKPEQDKSHLSSCTKKSVKIVLTRLNNSGLLQEYLRKESPTCSKTILPNPPQNSSLSDPCNQTVQATDKDCCAMCHTSINKNDLSNHMKNVHGIDLLPSYVPGEKKACQVCGELVGNMYFSRHMKKLHKIELLPRLFISRERKTCEICGDTVARNYIALHKTRVHKIAPQPKIIRGEQKTCEICGKNVTKIQFSGHKKRVHGIIPKVRSLRPEQIICKTCGEPFAKSYISVHMKRVHKTTPQPKPRIIRGEQKACEICGNNVCKNNLSRHKKLLHGIIPKARVLRLRAEQIVCEICGESFSKNNIYRHMKRVHKIVPQPKPKIIRGEQKTCEICGISFSKNYITLHKKRMHEIASRPKITRRQQNTSLAEGKGK